MYYLHVVFCCKQEMATPESDEDLTIPRAAMNKMIKEILPSIRVANDSRELILNCCTEFIHLISSEANEICNQQTKKTISPEHVLQGWFLIFYVLSEHIWRLLLCDN